MVDDHFLADCRVKLVCDQASRYVPTKITVTFKVWQWPLPPPFVGLSKAVRNTQCERWVSIKKELIYVVVVDHHQSIGSQRFKPVSGGFVAIENVVPGWSLPLSSSYARARDGAWLTPMPPTTSPIIWGVLVADGWP